MGGHQQLLLLPNSYNISLSSWHILERVVEAWDKEYCLLNLLSFSVGLENMETLAFKNNQ